MTELLLDLAAFFAEKGDAFAYGVISGGVVAALWLVPAPTRHDKPSTSNPSTSARKSGRISTGGTR